MQPLGTRKITQPLGFQCFQTVLNGLKIDHEVNRMAFITRLNLGLVWSKIFQLFTKSYPNGSSITRSPGLVFSINLRFFGNSAFRCNSTTRQNQQSLTAPHNISLTFKRTFGIQIVMIFCMSLQDSTCCPKIRYESI